MEWEEPAEWAGDDDEAAVAESDEWVWLWVESGIGERGAAFATGNFLLLAVGESCALGGGGRLGVTIP